MKALMKSTALAVGILALVGLACASTGPFTPPVGGTTGNGAPPAPTGLAVTAVTTNSVSYIWSNGGAGNPAVNSPATGWQLEVSETDTNSFVVALTINSSATTNATVSGLKPGTLYWGRVRGFNN